jgi:hypothetical protein
MAQLIDLETAFWITIDVALASLIIYTLFRYVKLKKKVDEAKHAASNELSDFTKKFEEYILNYGRRWAVITIFNELINTLVVSNRLVLQKNLTTREILTALDSNLSRNTKTILNEMYNLYEAARFGGYEPSEMEINQFNKKLELLKEIITDEYSQR